MKLFLKLKRSLSTEESLITNTRPSADSITDVEARANLLDAMGHRTLRNAVVTNVLIANPILKSLHNSTTASPIEQDLQPWVEARDEGAHAVAAQSTTTRSVLDELSGTEAETQRACRRNRDLATQVLRLAREADGAGPGGGPVDARLAEQIASLETTLRTSRQRWRVVKGAASGIVAGSGVDWVGDEELRDLVLDPE